MTSWVRAGVQCECVDQEWHDFDSDDEVAGPMLGETYVVAEPVQIDGEVFIRLFGVPNLYEACAFRPVRKEDQCETKFVSDLINSSFRDRAVVCA